MQNNEISVCKGDVCVNASGEKAKAIGAALTFAGVAFGIAALIKAFK